MARFTKNLIILFAALLLLVALLAACGDEDDARKKPTAVSPLMAASTNVVNLPLADEPAIVHTLPYTDVVATQSEDEKPEPTAQPMKATPTVAPTTTPKVIPTITPAPIQKWTQEELDAMARTLAGECYDDKPLDKRKVCETILNRVSVGGFGDGVLGVLTAENQFAGYWYQSREVSENDYEVAEKALSDWYDIGCQQMSPYLFFVAGDNRENVFSATYE